jgi:hypothetical protein
MATPQNMAEDNPDGGAGQRRYPEHPLSSRDFHDPGAGGDAARLSKKESADEQRDRDSPCGRSHLGRVGLKCAVEHVEAESGPEARGESPLPYRGEDERTESAAQEQAASRREAALAGRSHEPCRDECVCESPYPVEP